MRTIVVGVDGSDTSKEALRWAGRLAPVLNCTIQAVTAWEFPVVVTMAGGGVLPGTWVPEEDARDVLTATVSEILPGSEVQTVVAEGHPANVLLEASKDAEMIIVGSRGLGGFRGALLGSVSSAVSQHAKCPVLVIPERP